MPVLVLATLAYVLAAWAVKPGFYDGFGPPSSYRWIDPPPEFRAGNLPPAEGSGLVRLDDSHQRTSYGVAITGEDPPQAIVLFGEGAFVPPSDGGGIPVAIKAAAGHPGPTGVRLVTNVYCVSAGSASLTSGADVKVSLLYAGGVPDPSSIFEQDPGGETWRDLGSVDPPQVYYAAAKAPGLGCFAAGYRTDSPPGLKIGGSSLLPIVVGLLVLIVLAAAPLARLRMRRKDKSVGQDRRGQRS